MHIHINIPLYLLSLLLPPPSPFNAFYAQFVLVFTVFILPSKIAIVEIPLKLNWVTYSNAFFLVDILSMDTFHGQRIRKKSVFAIICHFLLFNAAAPPLLLIFTVLPLQTIYFPSQQIVSGER